MLTHEKMIERIEERALEIRERAGLGSELAQSVGILRAETLEFLAREFRAQLEAEQEPPA